MATNTSRRSSKKTTSSSPSSAGLWDYVKWALPSTPAEAKRTAAGDNSASSFNVMGSTTRNDTTSITNNYVEKGDGVSVKDAATLVVVGAAVAGSGYILGSYLNGSGPASNNDNSGGGGGGHAQESQRGSAQQQMFSGRAADTITSQEGVVIDTPHIHVRATAVQKQPRRSRYSARYMNKLPEESASVRKLKSEALETLRSW